MPAVIYVTDDEQAIRGAIVKRLTRQGHHAVGYESGEALLEGLQHNLPDLVLLDVKMPGLSGLEALKHVRKLAPATTVIMLTAYATVQDAVETMKLGAYDFMIKSVDLEGIDAVISRALEVLRLRQRLDSEMSRQDSKYHLKNLEAQSPAMQQLLEQVREVAESPKSSVMLLGETGTGKEFLAHIIHHNGPRAAGPFIGVNCTAIPKELFESELFGFERGAFTGATQRKIGLLEKAEGGTLFLDEIGDLDLSMQAKLLRVIQERSFRRLGEGCGGWLFAGVSFFSPSCRGLCDPPAPEAGRRHLAAVPADHCTVCPRVRQADSRAGSRCADHAGALSVPREHSRTAEYPRTRHDFLPGAYLDGQLSPTRTAPGGHAADHGNLSRARGCPGDPHRNAGRQTYAPGGRRGDYRRNLTIGGL